MVNQSDRIDAETDSTLPREENNRKTYSRSFQQLPLPFSNLGDSRLSLPVFSSLARPKQRLRP
jgi:hypothetical protein